MNRTKEQKVLLTEAEQAQLLELSAALRRQRGPLIRDLIDAAYLDYQAAKDAVKCQPTQVSASRTNREGPRHGHLASRRRKLPSRIGAPSPHLRV